MSENHFLICPLELGPKERPEDLMYRAAAMLLLEMKNVQRKQKVLSAHWTIDYDPISHSVSARLTYHDSVGLSEPDQGGVSITRVEA